MAKRKATRSEQAPVEMGRGSASLNADGQVKDVATGPRQAKTDALNNAVWMQMAPGASRKRAALTTTPKAVRKSKKAKDKGDQSHKHVFIYVYSCNYHT
ncbi:hypothetical protein M378DRAFT_18413 [Amanita muscaria Koide BX008]|uniref:Uncharacterized protein n=1 Tax=Amanita muscaria (strain Koide BX008) TaxID=946122 RepID=A0A0C2SLX0_AMAMK|nr:hypothetical protein M378DRAFT_18413 [Amanita muscaria Koide BX008]